MKTRHAAAAALAAAFAFGNAPAGTTGTSDLSITMHDSVATYIPGRNITYTIVVTNAGPDPAVDAVVTDAVLGLAAVAGASWACVATGSATCTAGPVTGNILDTIDLPPGGTATYTLLVTAAAAATADLVNTATIAPPTGTVDPSLANNTATDTNTAGATRFVAATGTDSATCGGTATPCLTIQKAIDNSAAGDAVFVRAGTYDECIVVMPGTGVGGVLVLSDDLRLTGEFGSAIIDGAATCDAASGTPGPVVKVFDRGAIEGFVIKNGGDSGVWGMGAVTISSNQITTNATSSLGGGIYLVTGLNLSDPFAKSEISTNKIDTNTAARDGGGIYVDASAIGIPSLVEITGNNIVDNVAGDTIGSAAGGAIAVVTDTSSASDRSTVVITGNTLDRNTAKSASSGSTEAHGGAVFVTTAGSSGLGTETVTVGAAGKGNIVRNNVSDGPGGGISVSVRPGVGGVHSAEVSANTVSNNTGKLGGGGMYLFVAALDQPTGASPTVSLRASGNTLTGNHAQGDLLNPAAVGGGGLFVELDSARTDAGAVHVEIDGNTIQKNDTTTRGGGISLVASADDDPLNDGATAATKAEILFHHNLISQNSARDATAGGPTAGGVHGLVAARGASAVATLTDSFLTVVDNETELGTGGVEWQDAITTDSLGAPGVGVLTLTNSIVSANQGYGIGATLPLAPATIVNLDVQYSDVFGNISGNYAPGIPDLTGTAGNISVDPELDALFLPRSCGPTIDAGDPALDATAEPLPNGGRVNLGHLGGTASATRTFPDVNGDGTIDGLDVLAIAVSFAAASPDPRYLLAADRDLNGLVDGADLAFVSASYAQSCP